MRSFIPFLMVVLMTTLAAPQAITDPKQVTSKSNAQVEKSLSIEKLYMTRNVGSTTWSPDGKSIAFISNISGRNNIWVVPSTGGWPTQLTISDQRQSSPTWSPDGKWIAFQSDYDGDEQWDIYLVSPKTGMVVNLTNTRQVAELSPTWSPDGRYLAYEVKPKTSSVYEIDIYDTADAGNQAPDQQHSRQQDELESDLVTRRKMDRLYRRTGQGNRLEHLPDRGWPAARRAPC